MRTSYSPFEEVFIYSAIWGYLLALVSLTALRNRDGLCKPRAEWIYLLCRGVADLSRAINRKAMHGKLSSFMSCYFFC